jgi:5-(carboxyamino)imidazole ribonucleotide synthase
VLTDGTLVVNEMAPRPHNSGHYTIDACVSSQFEQQVRALAQLPLGDVRQHSPAAMLNILGDVWFSGSSDTPREPAWDQILQYRALTCTCMVRRKHGAGARWDTSLSLRQRWNKRGSIAQACGILGLAAPEQA